jgi:hypothetical protein
MVLRQISPELVESAFWEAEERFRDMETGYFIAVGRRVLGGRERDVIGVYEEEPDGVVLITVHPLQEGEKSRRVRGGRWVPL